MKHIYVKNPLSESTENNISGKKYLSKRKCIFHAVQSDWAAWNVHAEKLRQFILIMDEC